MHFGFDPTFKPNILLVLILRTFQQSPIAFEPSDMRPPEKSGGLLVNMCSQDLTTAVAAGAIALATQNVLGPTLKVIGEDLKRVYEVGRDKIILAADRKRDPEEKPLVANIRVARDVFENGSYTADEICAEYFGGILAACRSESGQDDSAMPLLNIIKGLSSAQLHLHHSIYWALNDRFLKAGKYVNVGLEADIKSRRVLFPLKDLEVIAGLDVARDLQVLHRVGLVGEYYTGTEPLPDDHTKVIPYMRAAPTIFGFMMYSVAHNKFKHWRRFSQMEFPRLATVPVPSIHLDSLTALVALVVDRKIV